MEECCLSLECWPAVFTINNKNTYIYCHIWTKNLFHTHSTRKKSCMQGLFFSTWLWKLQLKCRNYSYIPPSLLKHTTWGGGGGGTDQYLSEQLIARKRPACITHASKYSSHNCDCSNCWCVCRYIPCSWIMPALDSLFWLNLIALVSYACLHQWSLALVLDCEFD